MIKSPRQDEKLPTYLKDLSISTGKVKHEVSSFPGSLGAIINILDLLSTVPTQVNSEMMTVSLFRALQELWVSSFHPLRLVVKKHNSPLPHCSPFFVFSISGSGSMLCQLWLLGSQGVFLVFIWGS